MTEVANKVVIRANILNFSNLETLEGQSAIAFTALTLHSGFYSTRNETPHFSSYSVTFGSSQPPPVEVDILIGQEQVLVVLFTAFANRSEIGSW